VCGGRGEEEGGSVHVDTSMVEVGDGYVFIYIWLYVASSKRRVVEFKFQ